MIDIASLYIIGALFIVILAEFFFLQWIMQEQIKEKKMLLDELARTNRALVAKNAHEYVMTTSIDKVMSDEKEQLPETPDEIPEDQLNDKEWFSAMGMDKKADN